MDESIRTGRLAGLKQVQESMKSAWLNDTQSDAVVGVEEPSRGSLIDVMMSDEPGAARNLFTSYESGTVLTSESGRFGIYPLLIISISYSSRAIGTAQDVHTQLENAHFKKT